MRSQLFGADEVYRTTKTKIKHAPVPKLLAQTREEEAQARKAGMDKSAPKQYQFIKESLDALEAQYKAKDMAVREKAYERTRRGLHVSGKNVDVGDEDDDEVEDLRSKLSKMSDEEFKQLAMERKKRAEEQLSGKEEESSKSERNEWDRMVRWMLATRWRRSRRALVEGRQGRWRWRQGWWWWWWWWWQGRRQQERPRQGRR